MFFLGFNALVRAHEMDYSTEGHRGASLISEELLSEKNDPHIPLTRSGPETRARRIPDHQPSPRRPNEISIWEKRGGKTLGIAHSSKYPYSYCDIFRRIDDPELNREWKETSFELF